MGPARTIASATRRLIADVRREHPHLPLIALEDGLASIGPHIKQLQEHGMRFILGAKRGDHEALFEELANSSRTRVLEIKDRDGVFHVLRYLEGAALNKLHPDLKVNVLDYRETKPNGQRQHFSSVTDLPVNRDTVMRIMRTGRAHWRVENETINTLKNQGFQLEHNFGNGCEHLSDVLVSLMMLAFLIDRVEEHCCALFRSARKRAGRLKHYRERLRSMYLEFCIPDREALYRVMVSGPVGAQPKYNDSSCGARQTEPNLPRTSTSNHIRDTNATNKRLILIQQVTACGRVPLLYIGFKFEHESNVGGDQAMRPIPIRNHDHTAEELEQIARNCKEPRWAQRLRAVAMVVREAQRCEAAEAHGVNVQTLRDRVERYKDEGPEGLRMPPAGSRPCRLEESELDQLRARVEAGPEAEVPSRFRPCDIRNWILETFGVHYSLEGVRKLLRRLGFRHMSPRPLHRKADIEAQEDFCQNFRELAKDAAAEATG